MSSDQTHSNKNTNKRMTTVTLSLVDICTGDKTKLNFLPSSLNRLD